MGYRSPRGFWWKTNIGMSGLAIVKGYLQFAREKELTSHAFQQPQVKRMNVTVILCTFNRCRTLRTALESVAASQMPESVDWDVLVVDNNSKDQTREVVDEYIRKFPRRFHYLFEALQGKSNALNSGIREARGEILAFLDDDVTVEPTWLQHLTSHVQSGEWIGAGGRIRATESVALPRWLALRGSYGLGGVLCGLFDRGDVPCELDCAPNGSNMAFHRSAFEKYGCFRTDMGPSADGKIPRPNEDTEFGRRIMAAGERLRFEPAAVVYHPVLPERLRKDYFLSWWFDYGRAVILERGTRPAIFGVPAQFVCIPNLIVRFLSVRTLQWCFALNPQRRFFSKCWVWYTAGQISQIYRQSIKPKSVNGAWGQYRRLVMPLFSKRGSQL
jgi:glycosyltransferase involved in cell wall biosynthesis